MEVSKRGSLYIRRGYLHTNFQKKPTLTKVSFKYVVYIKKTIGATEDAEAKESWDNVTNSIKVTIFAQWLVFCKHEILDSIHNRLFSTLKC